MVELRCSIVSVGMVVGRRGTPWCCPPVGRRPWFDPCMTGWIGAGWYVCGLLVDGLWFLQPFGWCIVVLAALWAACSLLGLSRCSRLWRRRMLSLLSSRLFLGFVAAGSSVFLVLRPEIAERVVFVRRRRSRN